MAYATIADVRALGLLIADYPDADVQAALDLWSAVIDRVCRQWFESRTKTFEFDGTDSDAIHFGVPIISVEYLRINGSTTDLDTDYYKIYNGTIPDDRSNPRIKLVRSSTYGQDYFMGYGNCGTYKFLKGRQNQAIKGAFGYLEDSDTPAAIERALLKLVVEKLTNPIYNPSGSGSSTLVIGSILEERTDGHAIKYSYPGGQIDKRRVGWSGLTNDPEVLDILKMYKAPIGVATPADWSTP